MKKLQKYGILAAVVLVLVLILVFSNARWLFLSQTDMVTEIISGTPSAQVKMEKTKADICLYAGSTAYYPGMVLTEYNDTALQIYLVNNMISGGAEGEGLAEWETVFGLFSSAKVQNGKLCFLSPLPIETMFAQDDSHGIMAEIGGKTFVCNLSLAQVGRQTESADVILQWKFTVADTVDEAMDRLVNADSGTLTVTLDQMHYYEFDLSLLQGMLL